VIIDHDLTLHDWEGVIRKIGMFDKHQGSPTGDCSSDASHWDFALGAQYVAKDLMIAHIRTRHGFPSSRYDRYYILENWVVISGKAPTVLSFICICLFIAELQTYPDSIEMEYHRPACSNDWITVFITHATSYFLRSAFRWDYPTVNLEDRFALSRVNLNHTTQEECSLLVKEYLGRCHLPARMGDQNFPETTVDKLSRPHLSRPTYRLINNIRRTLQQRLKLATF
jgi:hypothetical protein